MAAARAACLVTAVFLAIGSGCGLDFDRYDPGDGGAIEDGSIDHVEGAAPGGDAATDGHPAEGGSPVDTGAGKDTGSVPPPDAPADVAPESAPPGCTLGNGVVGIPQAPGAITIDGDLSDWGVPIVTQLTPGNAALILGPNGTCTAANATTQCLVPTQETAEAMLLRDATNLYVAVTVTEPSVGGTNTTDPYYDDAVEVYVGADASPDGDYTAADHQYVVSWQNLVIDYGPPSVGAGQTSPPGVKSAVKVAPSNKQYIVEMSIALAQLGLSSLPAGQAIGFDFGVDHGQGTSATRSLLVWWMATHGTPGCTSAKCKSCNPDQPYCDTLDFGMACAE